MVRGASLGPRLRLMKDVVPQAEMSSDACQLQALKLDVQLQSEEIHGYFKLTWLHEEQILFQKESQNEYVHVLLLCSQVRCVWSVVKVSMCTLMTTPSTWYA